MQVTSTTHIEVDEQGVAWVRGANTKVVEIVGEKLAWGWSPEEIHANHPHLSLGQIYAAFSYYYDHQAALDADMARRDREVEEMIAKAENRLSRQKLLERAQAEGIKLGTSE